jgi:hypothetical protein
VGNTDRIVDRTLATRVRAFKHSDDVTLTKLVAHAGDSTGARFVTTLSSSSCQSEFTIAASRALGEYASD